MPEYLRLVLISSILGESLVTFLVLRGQFIENNLARLNGGLSDMNFCINGHLLCFNLSVGECFICCNQIQYGSLCKEVFELFAYAG